MCNYGYDECIKRAREFYDDWMEYDTPLPTNFKALIYDTIARHGSESEWKKLYDLALKSPSYAEKLRILRSLSNTKNSALLK